MPSIPKTATKNFNVKTNLKDVKQTLNDRFAAKVIDWTFKSRLDEGNVAEFRWNLEDKALLEQIFADPKAVGLDLPMKDLKFRRFVQSIIQNGLNSTDVSLFQRFKHRLPLRSLGLAYELTDFSFSKEGRDGRLNSKYKLQQGFYMLEISIEPRQFSARIQLDTTATYAKREEFNHYPLRAKSVTVAKRLLWLKSDADVQVAISTPDGVTVNKSDLKHFRLARLTRTFFLSRLFKKLGKPFDINLAGRVTDEALAVHWENYEHVFSQTYRQAVSRDSSGLSQAPTTTASPNAQLQEILRLLAAKR